MLKCISRLFSGATNLTTIVGSVAVALMMIHVTADVVAKYVFQVPLPGTISIVSSYYMVIVTFLCLGVVERRGSHISVEIIVELLPLRMQRLLEGVGLTLSVIVFSLLTWQSFWIAAGKQAVGAFETEFGIKILIWPSYYTIPIGAFLMTAVAVFKLVRLIATKGQSSDSDPLSPKDIDSKPNSRRDE